MVSFQCTLFVMLTSLRVVFKHTFPLILKYEFLCHLCMVVLTTFVIIHFSNFGFLLQFVDYFINYLEGVIVLVIKYCPDMFYFILKKLIGWTYLKCSSNNCSEFTPFPAVWSKRISIQINIRIGLDYFVLTEHLKTEFFHLFLLQR